MRRKITLIALALCLLCTAAQATEAQAPSYRDYTIDQILFMSPLMSVTPDVQMAQLETAVVDVARDAFTITLDGAVQVSIQSPRYEVQTMDAAMEEAFLSAMLMEADAPVKRPEAQCLIYDADGLSAYRLFSAPGEVWLGQYAPNTAEGYEIIMALYRLLPVSRPMSL